VECQHKATILEAVEVQERQRQADLTTYRVLRQDLAMSPGLFPPEQEALDQGVRYRAFHLACHYWEARWLLEREQNLQRQFSRPDSEGMRPASASYPSCETSPCWHLARWPLLTTCP